MSDDNNKVYTEVLKNHLDDEIEQDLPFDQTLTSLYEKKSSNNVLPPLSDLEKTTVMDSAKSDEPFKPSNEGLEKQKADTEKRNQERALELKKKMKQNILKRRQRIRTFSHIFGSILLLVFIISVSSFFAYYTIRAALDLTGIAKNEFEIEVEIPEYATTEQIAEILYKNNIISLPKFFKFYSSLMDADGKYLNGMFKVESTMTYNQLINTLQSVSRKTETVSIRIREGMTATEIGKLLEENHVCRAEDFEYYYKNKQNKYNFEKRILVNTMKCFQLEGYLYPDTYEFYIINDFEKKLEKNPNLDTSDDAALVADKIYANYNEKITKEMYKRTNELGLTLDELMTLASMVQAEAATKTDMELVASVFLNRLRNSDSFPYLESDVTILYAENIIKPLINSQNQGIYNPIVKAYNTYETAGIPPGPICNPGMDAIEAVLYAPQSEYFFFCANIETLEVFYAKTLEEHEANLVLAELTE